MPSCFTALQWIVLVSLTLQKASTLLQNSLHVPCTPKDCHDANRINVGLINDQVGIERKEQHWPWREVFPPVPQAGHACQGIEHIVKLGINPVRELDAILGNPSPDRK